MTLTMSLPNGRSTSLPILSVHHAVGVLRAFAQSLGVSVLAVDWRVLRSAA